MVSERRLRSHRPVFICHTLPEHCPRHREAGEGKEAIINGVQVDANGKPAGYWFNQSARLSSRQAEFMPANAILHRFRITRPEQKRGIPWAHASMLSMHYAGEFALSALLAAKSGADTLGFFFGALASCWAARTASCWTPTTTGWAWPTCSASRWRS